MTCAKCGGPLRYEPVSPVGPVFACACGHGVVAAAWVTHSGFSPETPYKPTNAEDKLEKTLVAHVTHELEKLGFRVGHVGQRRAKHSGTTVGLGDMLVNRTEWGNWWRMIETKAGKNKPSDEQQALIDAGVMDLARSLEDVLAALE